MCEVILGAARQRPPEGQVYFLAFHKRCACWAPKARSVPTPAVPGLGLLLVPTPGWGRALGSQRLGRVQTLIQPGSATAPGGSNELQAVTAVFKIFSN